jgi:hypothetical protein
MSNAEPVSIAATETPNPGGAAPAHRQCTYTKANGHLCRDWAIRGQDFCSRHGRFVLAHQGRPIDVPLLEDEDSVALLLSQTLRALAWGMLPVPNGRALLDGCRLAWSMQCRRLETAKFRLQLRRLNISENEVFDSPAASERAPDPGALCPEPGALCPDPGPCAASEAEQRPEWDDDPTPPVLTPYPGARFRDLKKNWDKEILHTENAMTDMYAARYGETREEFKAARATPFENLAKEEALSIATL